MKITSRLQLFLLFVLLNILFANISIAQNVKKQFKNAGRQMNYMLSVIDSIKGSGAAADLVSPRSLEKGKLKLVKGQDWTSGFFPGELWFMYERTHQNEWLNQAK